MKSTDNSWSILRKMQMTCAAIGGFGTFLVLLLSLLYPGRDGFGMFLFLIDLIVYAPADALGRVFGMEHLYWDRGQIWQAIGKSAFIVATNTVFLFLLGTAIGGLWQSFRRHS